MDKANVEVPLVAGSSTSSDAVSDVINHEMVRTVTNPGSSVGFRELLHENV